jgi:formate hydrogenlyase transcriptional activator
VRVIAATNQDLESMVEQRKFRADLYYRLNVFPLTLPPLRERLQDIPLLTEHFVQKFARQQRKMINAIPDEVMVALEHHNWPGNIRELQNVIERGVIMTTGAVLSRQTTEHLTRSNASPVQVPSVEPTTIKTLADAERAHITATMRETNWVIGGRRGAAAQLGLPRTTLLAKMRRLGISNGTPRNRAGNATIPIDSGLSPQPPDDPAAELGVLEAAV